MERVTNNRKSAHEELASQEELIKKAKEAASAGDPEGMVEALYVSHAIDGLVRRIHGRWPILGQQGAEDAVSAAMVTLYKSMRKGEKVFNPVAFLWKVADRRANDTWKATRRHSHIESWELVAAKTNGDFISPQNVESEPVDTIIDTERRAKAIGIARLLLPRLGQQNIQAVMSYVIDAVEAGRWDVPNQEIQEALGLSNDTVRTSLSRGFRRLRRLAQEQGLAEEGLAEAGLTQNNENEDEYQ